MALLKLVVAAVVLLSFKDSVSTFFFAFRARHYDLLALEILSKVRLAILRFGDRALLQIGLLDLGGGSLPPILHLSLAHLKDARGYDRLLQVQGVVLLRDGNLGDLGKRGQLLLRVVRKDLLGIISGHFDGSRNLVKGNGSFCFI